MSDYMTNYATEKIGSYFEGLQAGSERGRSVLLACTLEIGIPLEIEQLREQGGPTQEDYAFCGMLAFVMGAQADDLQFRSKGGHGHPIPYYRDAEGRLLFTPAFTAAMERTVNPSVSPDKPDSGRDGALARTDLSTAELCTLLIRGLAICAFSPGGITCLGTHFQATTLPRMGGAQ